MAKQDVELVDRPVTADQMLEEARKNVPEVTAAETKSRLDRGEVDLILDVREPEEWEKGHIPGAVHAVRGMLEWYADPSSPYAKPEITSKQDGRVVLHCSHGGRSLLAADMMTKMGYKNVASMVGGFTDWEAKGLPVER
jgi:rhodanese-related sulfurtransferase